MVSIAMVSSEIILPLSMLLLGIGLSIDISAVISFWIAKTTVNPMKPKNTSRLVDVGIYRYSRNPMYLGVLLVLCSWALWLGSAINFTVVLFFIWYITKFQIMPEERVLAELFPEEFESYKSRVRRWI